MIPGDVQILVEIAIDIIAGAVEIINGVEELLLLLLW